MTMPSGGRCPDRRGSILRLDLSEKRGVPGPCENAGKSCAFCDFRAALKNDFFAELLLLRLV